MTEFEALSPGMNEAVDDRLGDSFTYYVGGVPAGGRVIPGFLRGSWDDGGAAGLDALPARKFVKMARSQLPEAGPGRADRLTHPRLSGAYRPAVDTLTQEASYWLFEIQRAKDV